MFENLPQIAPASSSELVLSSLSQKTNTGSKLTSAEVLLGMVASVVENGNRYGPGPGNMPTPAPELPEGLKGALASAKV